MRRRTTLGRTASCAAALALASAVALTTVAPSASADGTLSGFRVKDAGGRIKHVVTVCTDHPHTLRFVTYLEPEDGWPTYRASYRDRQPAGCYDWTLSRRDIFADGFWYGRVKASIGGEVRSTRWREFYID